VSNVEIKTEKKSSSPNYWGTLWAAGIIILSVLGVVALIAWPWSIIAGGWVWLLFWGIAFTPCILWLVMLMAVCIHDIAKGK